MSKMRVLLYVRSGTDNREVERLLAAWCDRNRMTDTSGVVYLAELDADDLAKRLRYANGRADAVPIDPADAISERERVWLSFEAGPPTKK